MTKECETFSKLTGEYNKCFYMWKLSGFHGDFPADPDATPGDVKLPFSDFVDNNASLLYMHKFVLSLPDCLTRITSESGTMIHYCDWYGFSHSVDCCFLRQPA